MRNGLDNRTSIDRLLHFLSRNKSKLRLPSSPITSGLYHRHNNSYPRNLSLPNAFHHPHLEKIIASLQAKSKTLADAVGDSLALKLIQV